MEKLAGLIKVLSVPLILLNMLGGIVSGIWLAILGEWGTIGSGILFFFISTLLISIILMPSILLGAPGVHYAEKGNMFGMLFFSILSNVYTYAVVTVWCCGILYIFIKDATIGNLIPKLIWSYGVAIGPWSYMASKEQRGGESFASSLTTFLAELAYLVLMVIVIFFPVTLFDVMKVFAGFMLVALIIQMTIAYFIQKEMKGSLNQP